MTEHSPQRSGRAAVFDLARACLLDPGCGNRQTGATGTNGRAVQMKLIPAAGFLLAALLPAAIDVAHASDTGTESAHTAHSQVASPLLSGIRPENPVQAELRSDPFLAEPLPEPARAQDPERGDQALSRECANGDITACEQFAEILGNQREDGAALARARQIYSMICTRGSATGCNETAWAFYEKGDRKSAGRALFLFTETCMAGVYEACLQAADMKRNGEGGPSDPAGAVELYAIACDGGLKTGCDLMSWTRSRISAPHTPAGQ